MPALSSPLRYPGGKFAMAPILRQVRTLNQIGHTPMAEPFAGGAGASLSMLVDEDTPEIIINDKDPMVADFWWALFHQSSRFLQLIDDTPASMENWLNQREILRNPKRHTRLRRGFATFYLNRCNRSGIIRNGGPIGGHRQTGKWKIGARYDQENLRRRCEKLIDYADRIRVTSDDGIKFVDQIRESDTFLFIDPPYYQKGPSLYLNSLDADYHARLAETLAELKDVPWLLTYDDCPEIRALYKDWADIQPFDLRYSASGENQGKEVCITPRWMQIPAKASTASIRW